LDPIQKQISILEAIVLIGGLGGFVSSKKQPLPGEKTLWKGWFRFLSMLEGFRLALQKSYETG
jgi:hypothetical protein